MSRGDVSSWRLQQTWHYFRFVPLACCSVGTILYGGRGAGVDMQSVRDLITCRQRVRVCLWVSSMLVLPPIEPCIMLLHYIGFLVPPGRRLAFQLTWKRHDVDRKINITLGVGGGGQAGQSQVDHGLQPWRPHQTPVLRQRGVHVIRADETQRNSLGMSLIVLSVCPSVPLSVMPCSAFPINENWNRNWNNNSSQTTNIAL